MVHKAKKRRTVGDDVDTSHVLAGHEEKTNQDPVADALLDETLEHLRVGHAVGRALFDLRTDIRQLQADVVVVGGQASEVGQNGLGLFPAVLTSKPSRRLGAEQHANGKEDARDELETEREDPLRPAGRGDGLVTKIVDLVGQLKFKLMRGRRTQNPSMPPPWDAISKKPMRRPRIDGGDVSAM